MSHWSRSPIAGSRAVALATALVVGGACSDAPTLARTAGPAARPAFDVDSAAGEEVAPDSGAIVLYPSDGPVSGHGEADEGSIGIQVVAAAPRPIRVGVVQASTTIVLGSPGTYRVIDKSSGVTLLQGANGAVAVTLSSVNPSYYRLQVMCGSTAAVNARKLAAERAGHPTFTNFNTATNCTRLFIGQFASNAAFAVRNPYRNQLIAAGLAGTDSFWGIVSAGASVVYRVVQGGRSIENVSPVQIVSPEGIVTIGSSSANGARYRGVGEARVNGAGTLAGINQLPIEEYLYGVVPRELGPIAYPELEALKAQAVAARTYTLAGLGKREADGYDLRATTDDQVYGGYSAEHPLSTRAVDETRGIAATSGGKLISALYSSTSGGHTSNNEEAFNAPPTAYLRGVPDAERGRAFEHVPSLEVFRAHANPQSLRATREGDFESDWARLHRWTFEWTNAEISSVISAFAGRPVGRVLAINVTERGPSGRVLRIEYVTEAGTFSHTRDAIRSSLRYINASGALTNLPSTLFFVEPVVDRQSKETTGFRVYGGGFGHGVGLAQTGAVGMAEKGHTFEQILKHYYRGIDLTPWY